MEEKFYKEIGEFIRLQRRLKNYSQVYMATKLSISQNAYSKIEAGKTKCSAFRIICIFKLLDVDRSNFVGFQVFEGQTDTSSLA